jgi:uncharacterized protein (DUF2384 family)
MMKIKWWCTINAILGIILLSGCGTSYYYAEFIHPSKVYVPADVYRLGVVNRSVTAQSEAVIYTNGIPFESIRGLPLKAVDKTIQELIKNNEVLARYELKTFSLPLRFMSGKQFMREQLSNEQVDSICRALNLDGFASIDGAELSIRTQGEVRVVNVTDDFGQMVRVPEFNNESQITYSIAWRLYDNKYKVLTDTYQETYQRIFTSVAYSESEALQMGIDNLTMAQVAYLAGADYYTRIAPHWKEGFRVYYQTGSEAMYRIAQNLEYDGNWEEAARKWKDLTDYFDDKVSYRAHYNLAVAAEMLGDPREAREWLLKAMAVKDTKQARKYMITLEQQILIYDVVNLQLGITEQK